MLFFCKGRDTKYLLVVKIKYFNSILLLVSLVLLRKIIAAVTLCATIILCAAFISCLLKYSWFFFPFKRYKKHRLIQIFLILFEKSSMLFVSSAFKIYDFNKQGFARSMRSLASLRIQAAHTAFFKKRKEGLLKSLILKEGCAKKKIRARIFSWF